MFISGNTWRRLGSVIQLRFELYLILATIMMAAAIVPHRAIGQNASAVSEAEHQQLMNDVHAQDDRIDRIANRQIEIYGKVTVLEQEVADIHELAERREGLLDTMMVGIAVLIIEMAIRGIFKVRDWRVAPPEQK